MNNTFHTLEFDHILRQLEELACTKSAKERIRSMEPYLYEGDVRKSQKDTTEAPVLSPYTEHHISEVHAHLP